MDAARPTLPYMSKGMDNDFRDRMVKAAKHKEVAFTPQSIGTFLGVDRRKAAVWMAGSLPRADKLFEHAERFGVDPLWYATGRGDMIHKPPTPDGLLAHEDEFLGRFRAADPRWRLALQLLAALAVEDQIEVATDVNVIMARIAGKKPHELRPVGNKRMRDLLKNSREGWPPKSPKVKT
jgi:hypothetical protein